MFEPGRAGASRD